nr:hypothetical protein [Clostridium grantii]
MRDKATFIGGTAQIVEFASNYSYDKYIIVTEIGIKHN